MPDLTFHTVLPIEERDQAMGRYMAAFSRLEGMMQIAAQIMLGIDQRTAGPVFATLETRRLIDLLQGAGRLALTDTGANRVKIACDRR